MSKINLFSFEEMPLSGMFMMLFTLAEFQCPCEKKIEHYIFKHYFIKLKIDFYFKKQIIANTKSQHYLY